MYHASLFEFSHVGYDRLSDESLDNDEEALVGKVSVYGTKFLALKVQAVDDDGNRISLSGSVSPVTSEDHSDYTSGSLVSIKKYGDEVLFKDSTYGQPGLITNADNNPPDAQLEPDQKSSLVALEFSKKNSYILEMYHYAKYPRTTLMADISNMTLEQSGNLPAQTPAPTCPLSLSSAGSVVCDGVSLPNFPLSYGASESCVMDVLHTGTLKISTLKFWRTVSSSISKLSVEQLDL